MASNAHSIKFDLYQAPLAELVDLARKAFGHLSELQPGGDYLLTRLSPDESENDIVAVRDGLPRDSLPRIAEDKATFNSVTFTFYQDLPGSILELLLSIHSFGASVALGIVFMSDVLRETSLKGSGVVKMLDVLLPELGREAALLCDKSDEGAVDKRLRAGESLSSIILKRARGEDALPPPLLAVMRADLCDEETLRVIRASGMKVRMTLHKHLVLSTVEL